MTKISILSFIDDKKCIKLSFIDDKIHRKLSFIDDTRLYFMNHEYNKSNE